LVDSIITEKPALLSHPFLAWAVGALVLVHIVPLMYFWLKKPDAPQFRVAFFCFLFPLVILLSDMISGHVVVLFLLTLLTSIVLLFGYSVLYDWDDFTGEKWRRELSETEEESAGRPGADESVS
jgi:hypothetical protein